jgi:hypothetical protein
LVGLGSENLLKTYWKPLENLLETVGLGVAGAHTISLPTHPISHHQLPEPHWNGTEHLIFISLNNSIAKSVLKRGV